jgi:CRISPR system Cascade subunit CasD
MQRYLLLMLEGPLLAFGAEAVDAYGVVGDFPAASMLTGLLANALGWRRGDREALARLQTRLHFAARIDREGERLTDFQTAQIGKSDRGWTTHGVPEGRAGGAGTYASPHIRRRDYDADKQVLVAVHLSPENEEPTLEQLSVALHSPARPIFLGRKSCVPSRPVFEALVEANDILAALAAGPRTTGETRVMLPGDAEAQIGDERRLVTDHRNWLSGVHGGSRAVLIRRLPAQAPKDPAS